MLRVFGSVVSWLDEPMQTWLPLCESSLLTTVTKIQSEVFLPVYLYSKAACWQQELGFGPAVQQFVFLSIFLLFHFPKYYLANEKEENYTDLLKSMPPHCKTVVLKQIVAECYFANEWKWPCLVMFCMYIHLFNCNKPINIYKFMTCCTRTFLFHECHKQHDDESWQQHKEKFSTKTDTQLQR